MLVEFRVENFGSIQGEQVFSMLANNDKTFEENNVVRIAGLRLLKSGVIYGANASGKSNFIKALKAMRMIVRLSAKQQRGESLQVTPFLLGERKSNISKFEIIFIVDNIRYQYGFSCSSEKIYNEWLYVFGESNRLQKWFERDYRQEEGDYLWGFGSKFSGKKQLWADMTRDNSLFLSTAVQLNSEQLRPVFDFFDQNLKIAGIGGWSDGEEVTIEECKKNKEKVLELFRIADFDIHDIGIQEEGNGDKDSDMQEESVDIRISFVHLDQNNRERKFDFTLESDGTQRFFSLIGAWMNSLREGHVLFFDELNNHLHPLMTKFLIDLFHNKDLNKNNAQLIFSTHETSILNQGIFRRDQIWFCQKQNKATMLYPLSDFKMRKDKVNLESDYLLGRFGALPYFQEIFSSMSKVDE